jgi:hypothetical protein
MTLLRSVLCLLVVDAPAAPDSSKQRTGTVAAVPAAPERGAGASGGSVPKVRPKPSNTSGLIVTTSVAGLVPCAQNRSTPCEAARNGKRPGSAASDRPVSSHCDRSLVLFHPAGEDVSAGVPQLLDARMAARPTSAMSSSGNVLMPVPGKDELWHFVIARLGDHRAASVPKTSPVLVEIGLRPRSQPRRPLRGPDGSHHWRKVRVGDEADIEPREPAGPTRPDSPGKHSELVEAPRSALNAAAWIAGDGAGIDNAGTGCVRARRW